MSLSLGALADKETGLRLLNEMDGMAGLRHALAELARRDNAWAGIPMLLEDLPLTIEPRFPRADKLMAAARALTKTPPRSDDEQAVTVRNRFWSWHRRCTIVVFEADGKIRWCPLDVTNRLDFELTTLFAADAWGIEQESNAVHLLGSMLRHRQFKQYLLTGMFMEQSERSGVHYLFRKLRPTLAITWKPGHGKILCALCLHPIGYYDGSWAGAMTPTDDVIAHLALMRGDEAMFWRRANQHPAWVREAGI